MDGDDTVDQSRLRQLIEAGVALSSELSLNVLLGKLVETAAQVTGARYAALGVLDSTQTALGRFVTFGIEAPLRAEIGAPPKGHGILGLLIQDAVPLRLPDLMADPRAVGFPAAHPPMHSFLGVPVMLRRVAYGHLYLTEKAGGGSFTLEDEQLVTMLAAQAAVGIENARLYEAATGWLEQVESVNAVANQLVTELETPRLLDLVAASLCDLIGARATTVWLLGADGSLFLAAAAGDWNEQPEASRRARGKLLAVYGRGRSERSDSLLDDPEVDQQTARRLGFTTGLWIPLLVQGRAVGIVACNDKTGPDPRFTEADARSAEMLAARAAVAVDLRQRLSHESVRSMLAAQESERTRLARELHDQTGQALTSILLALKPLETHLPVGLLAPIQDLVREALADVRRLAVQLRPAVLDDFGLRPALERLVQGLVEQGANISLETNLTDERLPHDLETALFRITQEALANVVQHARAHRTDVRLERHSASITLSVEDNGRGFDPAGVRSGRLGLLGIRERLTLLAGSLEIRSAPGAGTRLAAEIPLLDPHLQAHAR